MRISDWSSDVCSSDLFIGSALVLLHNALDIFDHDDRVVDEDADRENHAEQRQHVDRKPQHPEPYARAEQRDGHHDCRDDGRPPVLEEKIHDEEDQDRSEEHTSELQSLMRISYAVFCLKKKTNRTLQHLADQNTNKAH